MSTPQHRPQGAVSMAVTLVSGDVGNRGSKLKVCGNAKPHRGDKASAASPTSVQDLSEQSPSQVMKPRDHQPLARGFRMWIARSQIVLVPLRHFFFMCAKHPSA